MLRLEDKRIRLKDPEIPGCDNYIQGMGVASFLPQDAFPQPLPSQGHLPLVFLPQGHHRNRTAQMLPSSHLLPTPSTFTFPSLETQKQKSTPPGLGRQKDW